MVSSRSSPLPPIPRPYQRTVPSNFPNDRVSIVKLPQNPRLPSNTGGAILAVPPAPRVQNYVSSFMPPVPFLFIYLILFILKVNEWWR